MAEIAAPFSSRNRGAHLQIDSDFPESARIGLLHLLHELVEKQYVGEWIDLARELERIARRSPVLYSKDSVQSVNRARLSVEELLLENYLGTRFMTFAKDYAALWLRKLSLGLGMMSLGDPMLM